MPSMTFNFSSEVADRIAAALGKAHNLVDAQVLRAAAVVVPPMDLT